MENFTLDQKVQILNVALQERYKASHEIRSRLQTVSFWLMGIFTTSAAWLVQSTIVLSNIQKGILILIVITFTIFLFETYISDLQKGFKAQMKAMSTIETILGLYEKGVYSNDAVYDREWRGTGTEIGKGKYFDSTKIMIVFGAGLLVLITVLKGCSF